MYDIRQGAGAPQCKHPDEPNYVSVKTARRAPVACHCYGARTLDLYPRMPEFIHVCELSFPQGMNEEDELRIALGGEDGLWEYPKHSIEAFHFWLLENPRGERAFKPTGYKTYRMFHPATESCSRLQKELLSVSVEFTGDPPRPSEANTRRTPGILWGDLHGMAFNQRPLDDFYLYATEEAKLSFAAAMRFSYNICVDGVWQDVKDAAERFTVPGRFVAVAGVEFGTPPDGSHRNAHFFHPEHVPPIFFEERPPALDPRLIRRFSPDTVFCRDLDDFYATVDKYGGIVSGHFHTLQYEREIMAEIWQKQIGSKDEEEHIFGLLNEGMRLGIVGGSDTHDSMPGNPEPEPGCPQTAGFMAVLADEIIPDALREAILQRRVYGTTGARIALCFEASGYPMGSVVPRTVPRMFQVRVEGTAPLADVELIRDGVVVDRMEPSRIACEGVLRDPAPDDHRTHWYLLRITQQDGHRAWSSPIWF